MTGLSQSATTPKKVVGISLEASLVKRLDELAAGAGTTRAALAAALLAELVPTITSVRTRLQITREPGK